MTTISTSLFNGQGFGKSPARSGSLVNRALRRNYGYIKFWGCFLGAQIFYGQFIMAYDQQPVRQFTDPFFAG
jgi:hypothetical protein